MTTADRARLVVSMQTLIFEAEDHVRDLEHQIAHQETKAANVLLSGWLEVALVWRERKEKVEDGRL